MIDFEKCDFSKLRKVSDDAVGKNLTAILLDDEQIVGTYKGVRDYVVFTDRRIIAVNVQGMTGKKQDFTSMPYSKITVFSVETTGVFDLDAELELYFSGIGKLRFEFFGTSNIVDIGRTIAEYAL